MIDAFVPLRFEKQTVTAHFIHPGGQPVEKWIEIRTNPITGRTSRVALARSDEKEPGIDRLPGPPPNADDRENCPFCRPQMAEKTPRLAPILDRAGRMVYGNSVLFPNLFPYGAYSAVSLFGDDHFVEIGTAALQEYADCLMNCSRYLKAIRSADPQARYMAITQNHLPSAGGSLVHPHLQINADRIGANHQRFLQARAAAYHQHTGGLLFSDYLDYEVQEGSRHIGTTGAWQWMAAYAPEGFYEIWGILPGICSLEHISESHWQDCGRGILNTQRFYRSLCRNGYNLGILLIEDGGPLEVRITLLVRSNYAPWARNDHTGFEVMLGDMATFTRPEQTAADAREFWE
jgi:galactose-1-phosphate uridylyltransferase